MKRFCVLLSFFAGCTASQTPNPRPSADARPRPALAVSDPAGPGAASPGDGHHHGARGYAMDFSEVERFARHFDSPDRDTWQKPNHLLEVIGLRAGQVVAEIGAGTGYFLAYWAKAVGPEGRVLALDAEPNMVEYMKRRAREANLNKVDARVVRPDDPNLPPNGVDGIVIVNTWHHIDDRPLYSAKLARALRPEGSIAVVDYTLDSDMGPPKEHRLPPERVMRELEGGGLQAQVVKEDLPKQYVVIAHWAARRQSPR